MNRFSNNFKKFARLYPKEALRMESIESKRLETIHPGIDVPNVDEMLLYGVGNGEAYTALKPWLNEDKERLLILIEPDIAVLKGLLQLEIGSEILKDNQVELHYYEEESEEALVDRLVWQAFDRTVEMIRDPRYPDNPKFLFHFKFKKDHFRGLVGEFMGGSRLPHYNLYCNLQSIPESYDATQLFGKAKGVPAYIVGAGPSLNKNGKLLKKIGDAGLIFASGASSYLALEKMGIAPDFAVYIDPNPAQGQRLKQCRTLDTPFFYGPRLNFQALHLLKGPKLYVPGMGVGLSRDTWIDSKLGLKEVDFEMGYNVVGFATGIATKMGCNPIHFVGMDLAFTGRKHHAEGVFYEPYPTDVAMGTDIYGEPILTRWQWLKESGYFSKYAAAHPDITWINATEGGIGMQAVPNRTLKESLPHKTKGGVPRFRFKKTKVASEQVAALLQELRESLQRISLLLEEANWEEKVQSEPAYRAILKPFDGFYTEYLTHAHCAYLSQRDGKQAKKENKGKVKYLQKVVAVQKEAIEAATRSAFPSRPQ